MEGTEDQEEDGEGEGASRAHKWTGEKRPENVPHDWADMIVCT